MGDTEKQGTPLEKCANDTTATPQVQDAPTSSNLTSEDVAANTEMGHSEALTSELPQKPVVDRLPKQVWIVALAGAAERFAYYALGAPLQNYMQNPRHGSTNPGALGLGQQTATNISNAYLLLQFVAPLGFAILSDLRFGRMKMLLVSLCVYQVGCVIIFVTSLPICLRNGAGLPGLIVALVLMGLGIAGVKSTMPPLLVDQYTRTEPVVLKTKGGQTLVSNRQLTIQFITNMFFWATNVASMAMVPSTMMEKAVDFWVPFLVALVFLTLSQGLFFWYRNDLIVAETKANSLPLATKALWCAIRHGFSLKAASPENQRERHGREVPWDDATLEDVKKALIVCRILLFTCPFFLAFVQVFNNLISQAGQMQLNGVPNDMLQAFNPVAIVLLGPVIQRGLFPLLRRMRIHFGAIARVTTAFMIMAAGIGYATGTQALIYSRGPCYEHPLACPAAKGPDGDVVGNSISVWVQMPVWFITAVSEIFAFATLAEIAYELAPASMKSLVQSVSQLTAGLATVLGIALSPITRDPTLVILYSVICGLTFVAGVFFWVFFRKLDRASKEKEMRA